MAIPSKYKYIESDVKKVIAGRIHPSSRAAEYLAQSLRKLIQDHEVSDAVTQAAGQFRNALDYAGQMLAEGGHSINQIRELREVGARNISMRLKQKANILLNVMRQEGYKSTRLKRAIPSQYRYIEQRVMAVAQGRIKPGSVEALNLRAALERFVWDEYVEGRTEKAAIVFQRLLYHATDLTPQLRRAAYTLVKFIRADGYKAAKARGVKGVKNSFSKTVVNIKKAVDSGWNTRLSPGETEYWQGSPMHRGGVDMISPAEIKKEIDTFFDRLQQAVMTSIRHSTLRTERVNDQIFGFSRKLSQSISHNYKMRQAFNQPLRGAVSRRKLAAMISARAVDMMTKANNYIRQLQSDRAS